MISCLSHLDEQFRAFASAVFEESVTSFTPRKAANAVRRNPRTPSITSDRAVTIKGQRQDAEVAIRDGRCRLTTLGRFLDKQDQFRLTGPTAKLEVPDADFWSLLQETFALWRSEYLSPPSFEREEEALATRRQLTLLLTGVAENYAPQWETVCLSPDGNGSHIMVIRMINEVPSQSTLFRTIAEARSEGLISADLSIEIARLCGNRQHVSGVQAHGLGSDWKIEIDSTPIVIVHATNDPMHRLRACASVPPGAELLPPS